MSTTNYPGGFTGGVSLYGRYVSLGDGSGSTYFVDGNSGHDGNNGTSWEDAFKTVAAAITVSHADIGRGSDRWARRNTIFIAGDRFVEDLTTLPQKTDIIGVGSADGFKRAIIRGTHAITSGVGTRLIGVGFDGASAAAIVTLTGCSSVEFIGCEFNATGSATATGAIDSTATTHLKIIDCELYGAFSGDVIDIGAGAANGTRIIGNRIIGGADNGIVITGVATITGSQRGLIADNYIDVADKVIDTRATSVFACMNNICISGEALGGSSYVIDLTFAAKNVITGNDISVGVPSYTTVA